MLYILHIDHANLVEDKLTNRTVGSLARKNAFILRNPNANA